MTSASLTEQEVFLIISKPSTFDEVVSELWEQRKKRGIKPGSLSTISGALKNLNQKGYAAYDVMNRTWRVTSLGQLIMSRRLVLTELTSALEHFTRPLLAAVEDNPDKLIELLPTMFANSLVKKGKSSEQEEVMLKQAQFKLTLFIKEYPAAIEAIWGEGVKRLIGGFSTLMAAILLHCSSLAPDYRTQDTAAETIPKIADHYFQFLSADLREFLTNSLADLNKLAAQDRKLKANRNSQTPKKTAR